VTLVLALFGLLHAVPAHSTPLFPGDTAKVPTPLGLASSVVSPTILFDSGGLSFSFGPPGLQVFVKFEEVILKDPFAPLFGCGANCLDFVLQTELTGGPAGATTLLTSISMNTFGTSMVNVGWLQDQAGYVAPTGADRGPAGDTVFFDFSPGIPTGVINDTSQILVIRTDRTTFSPQNFVGFNAIETFPAGPTFTPNGLASVQVVPEPSSLMLMAGGAAFGAIRKRRRAHRI
jgi:hypothetical protein